MRRAGLWVFLYAAIIIGLSSIPGQNFPEAAWLTHDKLIHLGEYSLFGALVARVVSTRVSAAYQVLILTLLLAGVFGGLDEIYQSLIPGRDSSFLDWIADVLGVILGSWVYLWWVFRHDKATVR